MGRSRLAGLLLAVAWLAGAAGIAAWWMLGNASPLRLLGGAAAVLVSGALALRGWSRSPQGVLAWNGEGWTWKRDSLGEPGVPQCVLDLQHTMLLQWEPQGGRTRWLWVERRADAAHWDELRRAVYSRARSGAVRSAAPPREARP